jgi:hypothetical protein
MDSLFGTYEFLYPMIWAIDVRRFRVPGSSLEDEMLVMAAMDVLCMGGIAFCLRFLVALFQERKPRRIGDRVRPRLSSGENPNVGPQQPQQPMSRAA